MSVFVRVLCKALYMQVLYMFTDDCFLPHIEPLLPAMQALHRLPSHQTRGHQGGAAGLLLRVWRSLRCLHSQTIPRVRIRDLPRWKRGAASSLSDAPPTPFHAQHHTRRPKGCSERWPRPCWKPVWLRLWLPILQPTSSPRVLLWLRHAPDCTIQLHSRLSPTTSLPPRIRPPARWLRSISAATRGAVSAERCSSSPSREKAPPEPGWTAIHARASP